MGRPSKVQNIRKHAFAIGCGLCLLWVAFIFSRSLKVAEVSSQESGRILEMVQRILPWMTHTLLRKLGHLAEYALLGLMLGLTLGVREKPARLKRLRPALLTFWLPLGAGLLTGGCDELIQTRVPGRSGEVRDILIDGAGVALGLLLAAAYRTISTRIHKKTLRKQGNSCKILTF